MTRARTVEGVLNTFKEIEEEKGIVLCRVTLTCGKWQRDFTFAEADAGKIHVCDFGVESGETRLLATLSSSASEPVWQEADDAALMATYLIDRLNLQARLGISPPFREKAAMTAPAIEGLKGESEQIRNLGEIVARIIEREPGMVLILGESGTGKELIARHIHKKLHLAGGPFVAVNCGSLPKSLIESELFGYEQGAFTDAKKRKAGLLEQAKGGTIFFDEMGELPLEVQSTLLRVLEVRTYRRVSGSQDITLDACVIAATNRDLSAEMEAGRFRDDLFYRLVDCTISLPPLRERGDDLFLIADHFIEELNKQLKRQVVGLAPEVIDLFRRYRWPGNVRELYKVIKHTMTVGNTDIIMVDQLPTWAFKTKNIAEKSQSSNPLQLGETFKHYQYRNGLEVIQLVREECRGNNTKTAQRLGMKRAALVNWKKRARQYLDKYKAG